MKILAADTALGACSVAVLDGGRVLAHRFEAMERGHAEALAPMVDEAMRESGIAFADIDRLAVTTGPGTFTGQRVTPPSVGADLYADIVINLRK